MTDRIDNDAPIKVSEAKELLRQIYKTGVATMIWGPPGIGKTALVEQLAAELNARCKIYLAATMDPCDTNGVPSVIKKDGKDFTVFAPPEDFHELTESAKNTGPVFAVFDDLPAGDEHVFNSLLRFFHNREVGGHKIRENVVLIATGNRVEDAAGAREMTTALANRFIHITLRVDSEEWHDYAVAAHIQPQIVGFISKMPAQLWNFKPEVHRRTFPSPRSIEMASRLQAAMGSNHPQLFTAIAGCCGPGWAHEYMAFLKLANGLVSPKEIFANPEEASVPNRREIDLLHAISSNIVFALAEEPTHKNVIAALKYINRYESEDFAIKVFADIVNNVLVNLKEVRTKVISDPVFRKIFDSRYKKIINIK